MKSDDNVLNVVSVRLVNDAPIISDRKISTPEDAIDLLGKYLCDMDREVVCVINLKTDGTPINCSFVSIGALNFSIVEPREIFKASILSNAHSIILLHNHPSGALNPSYDDIRVTGRIEKCCDLLGFNFRDHIIVGTTIGKYFSFRENKLICKDSSLNEVNTDNIKLDVDRVVEEFINNEGMVRKKRR